MITVRILGIEDLVAKLNTMAENVQPTIQGAMNKSMQYVHSQVPPYPGEPPGSRYRRTGQLGRSITTKVEPMGAGAVGIIGTNLEYAPWVISETEAMGAGPQTSFHAGRWWLLQQVVRGAFDGVVRIFEQAIRGLVK